MREDRRVAIDCRESPKAEGCTLSVAGTEREVLETMVPHAARRHGMSDASQAERQLRSMMKEV